MRTQRKRTEKRHILRSLFKLLTPTGQKFVKRYIFSPMLAVMFGLGSASVWGLGVTNTADLATFNPSYTGEVFTPGTVIANKDCVVNLNTIIGNNTVFQSKNDGTFTFTKGVEISSSRTASFVFDFNTKFSGNGSLTVNNAQPIKIQKNFDIQEMQEFEFTAETSILDGGEIITSKTSSAIISNTFNSNGTEWNGNVTITSGTGNYTGTGDTFNSLLTIENSAYAVLEKGTAGTIDVGGHEFDYNVDGEITGCKVSVAEINGSKVTNLTIGTDNGDGTWKLANGYVKDSTIGSLKVQGSDNGFYSIASISGKDTKITDLLEVTDGAYAGLEDKAYAKTINVSGTGSLVSLDNSLATSLTIQNGAFGYLVTGNVTDRITVDGTDGDSRVVLLDGSSAGLLEIKNGAYAHLDNSESYQGPKTNAGTIIVSGEGSKARLDNSTVGTEGVKNTGTLAVTGGATADLNNGSKVLETINVSGTGEGHTIENPLRSTVTLTDSEAGNMEVTDSAEATLKENSTVGGLLYVNGAIANVNEGSTVGSMIVQNAGTGNLNAGNVTKDMTVTGEGSKATLTDSKAGNMEVTDGAKADLYNGSKVLETINVSGTGEGNTIENPLRSTVTLNSGSSAKDMNVLEGAEAKLNNSEVTNNMTVTDNATATLNNSTVGTEGVEGTGTLAVTGGAEATLDKSEVTNKLTVDNATGNVNNGSTVGSMTVQNAGKGTLNNSEVTNKLIVKDANSSAILTDSKAGDMEVTGGAEATLDKSEVTNDMTVTGEGSSATLKGNSTEGSTVGGNLYVKEKGKATLNNSTVGTEGVKDTGTLAVTKGATAKLENNSTVTNKLTVTGEGSKARLDNSTVGTEGVEGTGTLEVTGGATADLYDESKVLETINVSGTGKGHTIENPLRSTVTLNSGSSAKEMNVTGGAEAKLNNGNVTNDMTVTGEGSSATLNNSTVGTEGVEGTGTLAVTGGAKAVLAYAADAKTINVNSLGHVQLGDLNDDGTFIEKSGATAGEINVSGTGSEVDMYGSTAGSLKIENGAEATLEKNSEVTNKLIVKDANSFATLTDSEAGNMEVTGGATADLYDGSKVLETINVSGEGSSATLTDSEAGNMEVTGGAEAKLDKSEVTNNMIVTGEDSSATLKGNSTEGSTVGGNLYVKEKGKATLNNSTVGTEGVKDTGTLAVTGGATADLNNESKVLETINVSGTGEDHTIENPLRSTVTLNSGSSAKDMNVLDGAEAKLNNGKVTNDMTVTGEGSKGATAKLENNSRVEGKLTVNGGGEYERDADGNIVFDENGIAKLIGSKVTMATGSSASSLDVTDFGYAELDNASIDGEISISQNASVTLNESTAKSAKITNISSIVLTGQNTNITDIITVSGYDSERGLCSGAILKDKASAGSLTIENSAKAILVYAARAEKIDVKSLGYVQLGDLNDDGTFIKESGAKAGTIKVGGHDIGLGKVSVAAIYGSEVTDLTIGTDNDGTWDIGVGSIQNGSSVTNLTVQGSDNGFYSIASISGQKTEITKLLEVTDGAYAVLEDKAYAKTINVSGTGSEVDMYGSTANLLTIKNSAYAVLAYAAHAKEIDVNSLGYVQLGDLNDDDTVIEGSGAFAGTIKVGGHEFFYEDGKITGGKVSVAEINGSKVTNLTIGTENDDLANGYVKNSTIGSLIVQGSTPLDNGNYYLSYGSIDNTTIQNITIKEGALVEWFGEDSKINESGSVTIINKDDNKGTYLVTGVETIVNAGTIDLDGKKATLWFTDIKNPSHAWGTGNGKSAPDRKQYIGTADPDTQKVTFLHYDNISEYIKTAAGKDHNHVINGELKGDGTLAIVFGAETSAALLVRGKASEFQGTAEVYRGALVVDGTTVGKENTGTVNVYRDARDGSDWYSGGTLAFTSSNGTAPAIHTGTIDFTCRVTDENGEEINPSTGSLLYFDTQNVKFDTQNVGFDTKNVGTLATIDAKTIKLDYDPDLDGKILDENGNESMENTRIWYDGAYNLAGKDLKIELGKETQFENTKGKMLDDDDVNGFFSTQLIKAERENNNNNNVINLNVQTFTEYAADKDWGGTFNNSAENAEKLINELLENTNGEYYKLADAIYNENNEEKVKQTISNLGHNNGLVNILGVGNNLGMVGSSFFGGGLSSMGGVTQRGQEEQAENPVSADPLPTKEEDPNKWTAWASYSHSSINASSYQDGGTIDGYDVRRTGILTGLRKTLSDTFSMGVLFAYSAPELNQSGAFNSYEWTIEQDGKTFTSNVIQNRYHSNIEMDDFQFALHFEKMLGRNWQLSAFLGGGAQTLDWNRKMCVDQQLHEFTGDTTGNTLTATIYLIKNLQLTKNFSLMPTVGLDSEHSWLWGFREEVLEEGMGIKDLGMNLTNILATDQSYRRMTYSRQTFRIGTTATLTSPSNIYGFSGRIFYGRQISDKESATLEYTNKFLDDSYFSVDGHKMGRDSWNLGFGGYMYLNTAKTLTIKADYNTIMYRNSSTQNVTAGLQWRF